MRILIIGVSGFIGNNLFDYLKKDFQVYGISRTIQKGKDNLFTIDLQDEKKLTNLIQSEEIDTIINLAAILTETDNSKDPMIFYKNLDLTQSIISVLKKFPNIYVINFSSSAVYPNIKGKFNESSTIAPYMNSDFYYGLSKFVSENFFNYETENEILHLRVGYVYGPNMNPQRIHMVFEKELSSKNTITIWGNGKRTIPQISIENLCTLVKGFLSKKITGTLNVADENISLKNLAKRIITEKGDASSKIKYLETKGNNNKFQLSLSRLKSISKNIGHDSTFNS